MTEESPQIQGKKIAIAIAIAVVAFAIMINFFNFSQSMLVASIVLLVALWTNEGIPLGVVSLLPIILFPSFGILSTAEVTSNYAKPIIYLFLGGFLLAIAVEKTNLHKWIANKILKLFPNTAKGIIFALIITSGLLSSVLSNTTTTLLLLPIALYLSEDARLKMRFALGIAYGASVGGILTPIGTPPNLILMGIVQDHGLEAISFVQWVWMVAPLVIVMFVVVGFILSMGLKDVAIEEDLEVMTLDKEQKKVIYLLLGVVLLLFANAPIKPYYNGLGLSEPGILLGAGLLLFMPPFSVLSWDNDKCKVAYRIMFLFGAGFAIAMAFTKTGMADQVASYLVSLTTLPTVIFMLAVAALVTFTTEITSNTALISIMLPILYAVTTKAGLDPMLFMMVATVCASYAFMLPIATPPNAIAMSSGVVNVKTMAFYGIIFNLLGISLIVLIAQVFWRGIL
jgi:sodium-dependent dicarboxylate transporter 2/3/5